MKKSFTLLLCATTLLLAQCAAPRQAPDARGVSFPLRDASYLQEGIIVAPETVRRIAPGATPEQVRQLLGNPHFSEGLFTAQDWNYILDLPTTQHRDAAGCQFQVQFDAQRKVKATYWQTEACAAAAAPPPATIADASNVPTGSNTRTENITEDDLRFAFGRSGLDDLEAPARERLQALAARLGSEASSVQQIAVYGYADRIGSAESNYGLSLARARTVADVFVRQGIDPQRIEIVGKGRFETKADCGQGRENAALIDCLAPDRRVAVTVRTSAR